MLILPRLRPQQSGVPARHDARAPVSNFCIPATGNPALNSIADLPGPGSLSFSGDALFFASPSGAFLTE